MKQFTVTTCSPKAAALLPASWEPEQRQEDEEQAKYPLRSLLIGESFTLPYAESNPRTLAALRASASSFGKKLNRKYKVLTHDEFACFEVARIG